MGVVSGCGFSADLVDHHEHDALGDGVPDVLADDGEVGVHQVSDGLNLPL